MKKLFVGLLAAFMMVAGLVAVSSTSASAAPRCPYNSCPTTNTSGKAVSPGNSNRVRVNYRVRTQGNVVPRGSVKVILKGNGVYRSLTFRYPGKSAVNFGKLPRGTYQVTIKYIPGNNSFARSSQRTVVTV